MLLSALTGVLIERGEFRENVPGFSPGTKKTARIKQVSIKWGLR